LGGFNQPTFWGCEVGWDGRRVSVGEEFWISFGICAKRNSKGKGKLKCGIECVMEQTPRSAIKGCTVEKHTAGGKWL
jgi:hypothetical protein